MTCFDDKTTVHRRHTYIVLKVLVTENNIAVIFVH